MRPLIHIGYHKTGTTWLQKNVFPNEALGFSLVAGPLPMRFWLVAVNDFDFDPVRVRRRFTQDAQDAVERGLVPTFSHERMSGSPYAGGHDSKTAADRLAAVFPEARILVVVREQRSMILSVYKQYVRWGGSAPLWHFLNPVVGIGRMPAFRYDFFEYHRLITYYRSLFGDENVLALPYELLRSNPKRYFGRMTGFLDLPDADPPPGRSNISPSAFSLSLKRRANKLLVRDALNPAPLFGSPHKNETLRMNKKLQKACRRIDAAVPADFLKSYEARWRGFVDSEVGDRYADSNAKTSELLGMDLKTFGYT